MGRAWSGVVAFSPDGSLGAVAQDDGTLGIFTLDGDFAPTVVEAAWTPGFYAGAVLFDGSGERAWIVDGNWANNGGGIYEVAFDCETGAPTLVGEVIESKLASALFVDGTDAILVADAVGGETGGHAWALSGWPAPTVVSGVTLFDYEDSMSAGSAVAGGALLVGDNSEFSGEDNRVSVAGLDPFEKAVEFTLLDPFAMVASPWEDAVLVSSGYADTIYAIPIEGGTATGIVEVASAPLPGGGVATADGLALVVENVAIRLLQFDGKGGAEDLGAHEFGSGSDAIPGAIGVQP